MDFDMVLFIYLREVHENRDTKSLIVFQRILKDAKTFT